MSGHQNSIDLPADHLNLLCLRLVQVWHWLFLNAVLSFTSTRVSLWSWGDAWNRPTAMLACWNPMEHHKLISWHLLQRDIIHSHRRQFPRQLSSCLEHIPGYYLSTMWRNCKGGMIGGSHGSWWAFFSVSGSHSVVTLLRNHVFGEKLRSPGFRREEKPYSFWCRIRNLFLSQCRCGANLLNFIVGIILGLGFWTLSTDRFGWCLCDSFVHWKSCKLLLTTCLLRMPISFANRASSEVTYLFYSSF